MDSYQEADGDNKQGHRRSYNINIGFAFNSTSDQYSRDILNQMNLFQPQSSEIANNLPKSQFFDIKISNNQDSKQSQNINIEPVLPSINQSKKSRSNFEPLQKQETTTAIQGHQQQEPLQKGLHQSLSLMPNQKKRSSQLHNKQQDNQEFTPKAYGDLSDNDFQSPEFRKSKFQPPQAINLNQLYAKSSSTRRLSGRNRKSSRNIMPDGSDDSFIKHKDSDHQNIGNERKQSVLSSINHQNSKGSEKNNKKEEIGQITQNYDDDHNYNSQHTTRQLLLPTDIAPLKYDKPSRDATIVEHDMNQVSDANFEKNGERSDRDEINHISGDDDKLEIDQENSKVEVPQIDAVIKKQESNITSNTERSSGESKFQSQMKSNKVFADSVRVEDAERLRKLKNYKYFIILPDDYFKTKWDLLMTIIAFYDVDEIEWVIVDSCIDCFFAIDMVLNFFMAYYNKADDIVDNRKKIACNYVKGWFLLDISSIFPITQIIDSQSNFEKLLRLSRLPKLYRLIKVFRLMRIIKVVKERSTLVKQVNDVFKVNAGFERLILFIILSVVLCHIFGCFWQDETQQISIRVIIAAIEEDSTVTWIYRNGYQNNSNLQIYVASMYFTIATITTVGFGDITGYTQNERLMCILLMLIGVFAFSFSTSQLSSMLSSIDARNASLNEKMDTLNKIRRDYTIGFEFFRRLRMAIKYDYQKNAAVQFGFLNELPQNLKIELSLIMHKEIVKKVYFFQDKPPHFIAFIGPLLKPLHIEEGNYVYKEKDPIEEIFFLIKGKAALVHKDIKDSAYLIIDQGYFFGEIDFVYQNNEGKRRFTVKAMENCHLLTINKVDLAKVDAEYEDILSDLFANAQKRLRRTLKIKDESENFFVKKQIGAIRASTVDNQIRRMSTALGMQGSVKRKKNSAGLAESMKSQLEGSSLENQDPMMLQSIKVAPLNQIDEADGDEEDEEDDEEDDDDLQELSEDIRTDSTFIQQQQKVEEQAKKAGYMSSNSDAYGRLEDINQREENKKSSDQSNDDENCQSSDQDKESQSFQEDREERKADYDELESPYMRGSIHTGGDSDDSNFPQGFTSFKLIDAIKLNKRKTQFSPNPIKSSTTLLNFQEEVRRKTSQEQLAKFRSQKFDSELTINQQISEGTIQASAKLSKQIIKKKKTLKKRQKLTELKFGRSKTQYFSETADKKVKTKKRTRQQSPMKDIDQYLIKTHMHEIEEELKEDDDFFKVKQQPIIIENFSKQVEIIMEQIPLPQEDCTPMIKSEPMTRSQTKHLQDQPVINQSGILNRRESLLEATPKANNLQVIAAKKRNSVNLPAGSVLDKLRQSSQRNLMPKVFKKTVNNIMLENKFKHALMSNGKVSPAHSAATQANNENNNDNAKDTMVSSMSARLNQMEKAVLAMEKSLNAFLSQQQQNLVRQQTSQAMQIPTQQELISMIVSAITEMNLK